ncbi:MAG: NAD(P)H-binding protein [Terriglobales bacterium]
MKLENLLEQGSPAREALDVVTGAFGFSGKYIAARLLSMGRRVRALTNHAPPNPGSIEAVPLDFADTEKLAFSLRGAQVLYNSYWVRFAHGDVNHQTAVANAKRLIRAAEEAGVERIVHISITNPSPDSPLPYFRGKAEVEEVIRESRLSYAILRPAVLFGDEDILINNIAWMLRRFPVFAIPGTGNYELQPLFADDLAALAVEQGQRRNNVVLDAVGPERYSYEELVRLIRKCVGGRSFIIHLPFRLVELAASIIGRVVNDVVLTRDEIAGLMGNLLVPDCDGAQRSAKTRNSAVPAIATTSLKGWLQAHASTVGMKYASELARHYRS